MAKLSVEKRLLRAQSLMRKGALQDARNAARSVLQDFPANKKAKQLLAKIEQAHNAGPVATPQADQEKLAHLVRLFESGDVLGAAELASRYTKQFPRSALVWNVAAAANKVLGRSEQAIECFERVVQITPTDADAHFNLGVLLQEEKQLRRAADSYGRALALRPNDAEAHNNLGKAVQDLGDATAAEEHFKRAIELDASYAQALYNLGVVRNAANDAFGAIRLYKMAIAVDPGHVEANDNLAICYLDLGKPDEAAAVYDEALRHNQDSPRLWTGKGEGLMATGQKKEAIECYERAIALSSTYMGAYQKLGVATPYAGDGPHLAHLLSLHESNDLNAEDRALLCYTLAKAYEDLNDPERAIRFLEEGGALRTKTLGYRVEQDIKLTANIKAFDLQPVRDYARRRGNPFEPTPIFILGMPRSGTSLTEQIISSHSQVFGAGELGFVGELGLNLVEDKWPAEDPTFDRFMSSYSSFLTQVSDGQPFVIDKMPHNFQFVGLICELFPKARLVHTMRDARAVCWSNYKLFLHAKGLGYSFSLENTVAHYKLYQELMDFWDSKYPGRIIHFDYEALIKDQERETRKLIAALDLEWEDGCLSPHKNNRLTRTASAQQVKERVYKGSSQKWRAYEPFLKDAFDAL